MLTSDQFDTLVDPVLELYERYSQLVINDIARRLAGLDFARPTAAWQMQRLSESGKVYENILDELAKLTGKSETELKAMFEKAGVKAMRFDDAVYRAAGLEPLPLNLSPAMAQVLAAGLRKTQGVVKNLTMTTALDGQNAFLEAADLAYMQVSTGAMSYTDAIVAGVKKVASDGLNVIQFPGRRDQLDVAIRRTLLTGINQTTGELQIKRADELGQDLVAVSAHIGARNTGVGPANHESWQGKIYSRSGTHKKYKPFVETTGYGTGPGLCGWNCVVGETLVSGPAIRAAYRRKYTGELIVIRTAGGHELTVTPNHPILTDQGWVAAGLLVQGNYVISRAGFNSPSSTSPNVDQYEASIQDVFGSLSDIGNVFRFPVSSRDFHGDVTDNEVDIVFPKGFLGDNFNSPLFQKQIKLFFGNAIEFPSTFISEGAFDQVSFGALNSPDSVMGGFGKPGPTFAAGSFQSGAHGVRPVISHRDTHVGQILPNQSFRDSNLGCDFVFPETGLVHREKFFGRDARLSPKVQRPISGFGNTAPFYGSLNNMQGTTVLIGDELVGLTGQEKLDNIIFIERKSTQGSFIHVYNLETEGGWYFANGIITHNCRHSFYPFFEGISENAYSKAELESYASKTVKYNGEEISMYDATQKQRAIERKIRYWKRQKGALDAAGLDSSRETAKVRAWQAEMRSFTKQTGLIRQGERERVISLVPKTKSIEKVKKINLYSNDNYSLGFSKDIRSNYPENEPGRYYCRSADTQISEYLKKHTLKDHPERIDWITTHPREIALAIQEPQIIEKHPWKRNNGHWSQTYVREIPEEDGFVVVAVSLANLPGETEGDFHQVTSIYFTRKRNDFIGKNGDLKRRWLLVK